MNNPPLIADFGLVTKSKAKVISLVIDFESRSFPQHIVIVAVRTSSFAGCCC